jgi:hypothetical protein
MTKELDYSSKDPRLRRKQIIIKSNGLKKAHQITARPLISLVEKCLRKLEVEPKWSSSVESENQYGKDFQITKYELPNFELYEKIELIAEKLVEALLESDKDEITREDFYDVIYEVIHSRTNKKAS